MIGTGNDLANTANGTEDNTPMRLRVEATKRFVTVSTWPPAKQRKEEETSRHGICSVQGSRLLSVGRLSLLAIGRLQEAKQSQFHLCRLVSGLCRTRLNYAFTSNRAITVATREAVS